MPGLCPIAEMNFRPRAAFAAYFPNRVFSGGAMIDQMK